MSISLNSSYGQYSRLLLLLLVLTGLGNLVTGCKGPLSLLTGGGPKVAANVQAAKTATQTIGSTTVTGDQKIEGSSGHITQIQEQQTKLSVEKVDKVTINETPIWMIVLLMIGWILPTPNQIAKSILGLFKRK
jgi:ABC-type enterobactin transport system permease subunit